MGFQRFAAGVGDDLETDGLVETIPSCLQGYLRLAVTSLAT